MMYTQVHVREFNDEKVGRGAAQRRASTSSPRGPPLIRLLIFQSYPSFDTSPHTHAHTHARGQDSPSIHLGASRTHCERPRREREREYRGGSLVRRGLEYSTARSPGPKREPRPHTQRLIWRTCGRQRPPPLRPVLYSI